MHSQVLCSGVSTVYAEVQVPSAVDPELSKVPIFRPGVCHNIAMSAARNEFFQISAFSVHSTSFFTCPHQLMCVTNSQLYLYVIGWFDWRLCTDKTCLMLVLYSWRCTKQVIHFSSVCCPYRCGESFKQCMQCTQMNKVLTRVFLSVMDSSDVSSALISFQT